MLKEAMERAVTRSGLDTSQIDAMLSGDLLNQLMSSSFTARDMHIPFLGLYGACSTMTESLLLGCMLIDGGFAKNVLVRSLQPLLYSRKTIQDACRTWKSTPSVSSVDGDCGRSCSDLLQRFSGSEKEDYNKSRIGYYRKSDRRRHKGCKSDGGGHGTGSRRHSAQSSGGY